MHHGAEGRLLTAGVAVADALRSLGGADVVPATAADSAATSATVDGPGPRGELVIVGIGAEPLNITPGQLVMPAISVHGHPSGTAQDVEDTLAFSALHSIRPLVETMPLDEVNKAFQRMVSGTARFRRVLTP